MNSSKPVPLFESADFASNSDLVACVSMLADYLAKTDNDIGKTDVETYQEAAREALSAVVDAERLMNEQAARILDLERLAMTDELTGLMNRRGFHAQLQRTLAAAQRYEDEGLLVYIDLDGFKPINDTYGHDAGDKVLRRVAKLLINNVRDSDYVGRLGGDEFAVLLTRTRQKDGLARAKALETLMNSTFVTWKSRMIPISASFGYETYGPSDDSREILRRADNAMYRSKRRRSGLAGSAESQAMRAIA